MENSEVEKVGDRGTLSSVDTASDTKVVIGEPLTSRSPTVTTEIERQIDEDEKEQAQHPQRLGIEEWKIRDADSKEQHNETGVNDDLLVVNIGRSIYEVARARDQTLTEKACCSSDVIRIWNQIGLYVKSKLREGCGVIIPGLCTFTLALTKRSDDRRDRFQLRRKPILVLSKVLTARYNLVDTSELILGFRPPATLINLTDVGVKAKVSRSIVEGVVTEVLQTFARALVCNKPIEFPFPFIGKLQVRNQEATMKFYEEFYKSMSYDLESDSCPKGGRRVGSRGSWSQEADQDSEILCGRITPLNIHIPTDTFRSVFHLREVRSVTDIIAVTEEDLRGLGCFEVKCLPRENPEPDEPVHDFPTEKCEPAPPEFVWCPPRDDGEGASENLHEEEGEAELINYYAKWTEEARMSRKVSDESHGECLAEDDVRDRPLESQALPQEIVTPKAPLDWSSFGDELELPCRHNFRPEPLYVERPSGNATLDMILPDKRHVTNALFHHHYYLCTKMLGIETVKQHFANKVTTTTTFNSRTPFDDL